MKTMQHNQVEKIITFIFGDLFVTGWITLNGILTDVGHFGIQVISTVVIGFAGGLAGMVAKDVYSKIKKRIKP